MLKRRLFSSSLPETPAEFITRGGTSCQCLLGKKIVGKHWIRPKSGNVWMLFDDIAVVGPCFAGCHPMIIIPTVVTHLGGSMIIPPA